MWLLRLLGVLAIVAVVGGVVVALLTRNSAYLRFSWRILRYALIVALLVFALINRESASVGVKCLA